MISLSEELCKRWMVGKRHTLPGEPEREAWRHPEDLVKLIDEWPTPKAWNPNYLVHLKCVAWLHDVPEDGKHEDGRPVTERDLHAAGIELIVIKDVMHLTQEPNEDKATYLARLLAQGTLTAKVVKCIDRTCNLREGRPTFKDGRWGRYVAETEKFILPLADKIAPWFAAEMRKEIAARPV